MTFKDYLSHYEASVLPLKKTSSQKTVKSRLRKLASIFGDKELPLNSMDVQAAITKLAGEYHPQTVQNMYLSLRMMLNSAKADGLITEIPVPVLPTVHKEEQRWFTPEEMIKFCKYDPMYYVYCETGARVGEVLALQAGDFDRDNHLLKIERSIYSGVTDVPKSRAGKRILSISGKLVRIMDGLCYGLKPDDRIITTSMNRELEKLHRACKALHIPEGAFHAFRRGNATVFASIIGAPEKIIAYRMGHSNLGLTLGRYAKYIQGLDKEWVDKFPEVIK